jgi:hypothetical protein
VGFSSCSAPKEASATSSQCKSFRIWFALESELLKCCLLALVYTACHLFFTVSKDFGSWYYKFSLIS